MILMAKSLIKNGLVTFLVMDIVMSMVLAFKPKKYLSASELNAHSSKNNPNKIVVYTATKTFTPYRSGNVYDDGSMMDEAYPIKKDQ